MQPNLISTFIQIVDTGRHGAMAESLRALNQELGTSYTQSRLREWERGDRTPEYRVIGYILPIVLRALLEAEGVPDGIIDEVVQKTRLAERR